MTNNERTFDVDIFPVTVDATGKFVGKQDNVIDVQVLILLIYLTL
jgi:hypothetical protein